jgi:hypothetical protein
MCEICVLGLEKLKILRGPFRQIFKDSLDNVEPKLPLRFY